MRHRTDEAHDEPDQHPQDTTPPARPWRPTIRTRLTLTYVALVTGAGAILIAMVGLYASLASVQISFGGSGHTPAGIALDLAVMRELLLSILGVSVMVLAALALASGLIGWVVAGRVLAPLATMSAAAREAARGDLSQRLDLGGPRDEIRELADVFDTMLDSLEQSLSSYQRFAANTSHELRTPLATIQTMIDVTLANPQADAQELRDLLERVRATNARNARIVDAMLDLAQAQSARLRRRPCDLEALVHEAVEDVAAEAREAGVRLDVRAHPDRASRTGQDKEGPWALFLGDSRLLRQAVLNVLRNAVRHNTAGGVVEIVLGAQGRDLVLTVTNTGPVVDAESLASLTEPFVRGRDRAAGSGYGLGLAIVDAVVRAHDGTLSLRARERGGLVTTLRVPAQS